jgi:hypothetical protein
VLADLSMPDPLVVAMLSWPFVALDRGRIIGLAV